MSGRSTYLSPSFSPPSNHWEKKKNRTTHLFPSSFLALQTFDGNLILHVPTCNLEGEKDQISRRFHISNRRGTLISYSFANLGLFSCTNLFFSKLLLEDKNGQVFFFFSQDKNGCIFSY